MRFLVRFAPRLFRGGIALVHIQAGLPEFLQDQGFRGVEFGGGGCLPFGVAGVILAARGAVVVAAAVLAQQGRRVLARGEPVQLEIDFILRRVIAGHDRGQVALEGRQLLLLPRVAGVVVGLQLRFRRILAGIDRAALWHGLAQHPFRQLCRVRAAAGLARGRGQVGVLGARGVDLPLNRRGRGAQCIPGDAIAALGNHPVFNGLLLGVEGIEPVIQGVGLRLLAGLVGGAGRRAARHVRAQGRVLLHDHAALRRAAGWVLFPETAVAPQVLRALQLPFGIGEVVEVGAQEIARAAAHQELVAPRLVDRGNVRCAHGCRLVCRNVGPRVAAAFQVDGELDHVARHLVGECPLLRHHARCALDAVGVEGIAAQVGGGDDPALRHRRIRRSAGQGDVVAQVGVAGDTAFAIGQRVDLIQHRGHCHVIDRHHPRRKVLQCRPHPLYVRIAFLVLEGVGHVHIERHHRVQGVGDANLPARIVPDGDRALEPGRNVRLLVLGLDGLLDVVVHGGHGGLARNAPQPGRAAAGVEVVIGQHQGEGAVNAAAVAVVEHGGVRHLLRAVAGAGHGVIEGRQQPFVHGVDQGVGLRRGEVVAPGLRQRGQGRQDAVFGVIQACDLVQRHIAHDRLPGLAPVADHGLVDFLHGGARVDGAEAAVEGERAIRVVWVEVAGDLRQFALVDCVGHDDGKWFAVHQRHNGAEWAVGCRPGDGLAVGRLHHARVVPGVDSLDLAVVSTEDDSREAARAFVAIAH